MTTPTNRDNFLVSSNASTCSYSSNQRGAGPVTDRIGDGNYGGSDETENEDIRA